MCAILSYQLHSKKHVLILKSNDVSCKAIQNTCIIKFYLVTRDNLHNTANLLPLKLRREIALTKIMFNQVQDNQGLRLRELSTRAHDGPVMEVLKPTSSKYMKSVAYRGTTSWNSLKPELRCLRDKNAFIYAAKSYFWEAYKTQNFG